MMRKLSLLLIVAASVWGTAPVRAAEFDGRWSVLVITEKGDCDKGYRYEVNVGGGKVNYVGIEGGVSMTGSVTAAGQVNITVGRTGGSSSDDRASGSGKLSASDGAGTWRASGSAGTCSGRWEAERR